MTEEGDGEEKSESGGLGLGIASKWQRRGGVASEGKAAVHT
jgi:hypothetical protein